MLKEKWPGERELPTYILYRQLPPFFFSLWTYHLLTACDTLILALEEKMNHLSLFIYSFSLMIGQISVKAFPKLSLFRLNSPGLFMNSLDCHSIFLIILVAFCGRLPVLLHSFLDFEIRAFSTNMIMFSVFFFTLFFIVAQIQFIFDHCWTRSCHFHAAINH